MKTLILIFLALLTQSSWCFAEDQLLENYLRLNGDPKAFHQIMCFRKFYQNDRFFSNKDKAYPKGITVENKDFITIADFNKPATSPRLFVLNLKTNQVKAYFVAHGAARPKAPLELFKLDQLSEAQQEQLLYPKFFSNKPGSNATPHGIFILGKTYVGSFGYSLKMHGLQQDINDNTFSRYVVMHGFKGISANNVALSQGCSMLEPAAAREVIDQVKDFSLYYIYSSAEKSQYDGYCADSGFSGSRDSPKLSF